MNGLCSVVIIVDPSKGVIYIWRLGMRRGAKVSGKRSLYEEVPERFEVESICGPEGI